MSEPQRQLPASTILLVDDEEFVRRMMRRILGAAGHRVLEAEDGLQALRTLDRDATSVRLVISDVAMPRMSGDELAAELRVRWPEIPILLISAYARNVTSDVDFLAKPFDSETLLRRVGALIAQ
ncbi:MAG TPA: response regulator [Gemmatimonadales bacterium]|nr:response regulator [Gemmatimonadales bacterium]